MSEKEKWISKALPKTSKGKLHKALHVKEGEKIPLKKIEKAEELNEELISIVGDIRTRIVQDHLQQVANFDKD
jgi:hypothetical protein